MHFHVTIDFNDDVWFAQGQWNEPLLRDLITTYAKAGISAIHWIDHGGPDDGLYDNGTWLDRDGLFTRFHAQVPRPMAVVCDQARRLGMKAYAVLKVFDLAFGVPWASLPPGQVPDGQGLPHVGGVGNAMRWICRNPTLRARLHPALREPRPDRPIRTIRLWHDGPSLPQCRWRLWASANNRDYRLIESAAVRQDVRRRRAPVFEPAPGRSVGPGGDFACVEFSGLDLPGRFVAIEPEGPCELANRLIAIAEMEDAAGGAIGLTHGLIPIYLQGKKLDWRAAGIAFDAAYSTDINGRGWKITESGGNVRVGFAKEGFVGLAAGRNEHLGGMLECAYPQVRQWLVGRALAALDEGCDGVDIRTSTHTESLDWQNYGFAEPIVEEFRRRYGRDIATEDFDRAAWRRLRGEYFTQFVAEASAAVRGRGRELLVHLADHYDHPLEDKAFHEMHFDWRQWLARGLVDRATFNSFVFRGPFYGDALRLCSERGVPCIMTHPMHSATDEGWAVYGKELIDRAVADGFEAFNIYESAAVSRLRGGRIELQSPSLWRQVAALR